MILVRASLEVRHVDWNDDTIAAEQFVDLVSGIARRWGIDPQSGVTLGAETAPPAAEGRNDIATLLTVAVALAQQRWPTLKGRFRI